jgi:hypothetical protein
LTLTQNADIFFLGTDEDKQDATIVNLSNAINGIWLD